MGGIRLSIFKSLFHSINPSSRTLPSLCPGAYNNFMKDADPVRRGLLFAYANRSCHTDIHSRMVNFEAHIHAHLCKPYYVSSCSPIFVNSSIRSNFTLVSVVAVSSYRSYSSHADGRGDSSMVPGASGMNEVDAGGAIGNDWMDKLKDAWQSVVDAVTVTGQKAKNASNELTPYAQQLLESHPYLRDVVVPVGGTLTAALMAWLVMPKILRRFHKYSTQGQSALLSGSLIGGEVPYEKSFWGALEDPVRYLVTFMAISQIGGMIAPNAIASQYIAEAWRGAIILSFIWFLYRWKMYVFSRALEAQSLHKPDRERLLALDKVSSVGLFVIGLMAFAEALGVAVQSVLTVGGIGGVASAFAARDILGNVLSGFSMQFSRPFSLGDTIKAGSIEGQVVEMGLTTTSLLNAENFPVIVPNSMFSSQVIVNKSRAQIENSFAELTLGCNLKHMSKDELYTTEQDILLQSVQIIKHYGGTLGNTDQTR
ncbi:hypothetical protein Nepgr_002332 [Nepenthes gracilis]|uniref:Mechanosensitive ion channel MscS domain-containing protein n=1 Tax=Nepenthes gracilis TaxID=150966 RepID=A0AAD3P6R8_NEPGR|nr:hypothetical protein Nepgr_002332 [Nepenthes gracilis]